MIKFINSLGMMGALVLLNQNVLAHGSQADGSVSGEPPILETVPPRQGDLALDSLIDSVKLWNIGHALKICFMDGSPHARKAVVEAFLEWASHTQGLSIDTGAAPNYRQCSSEPVYVRVSFSRPGNWSYVGTDASRVDDISEPTLNISEYLGALMPLNPEQAYGTALHEAGHALGLLHEHQHEDAACSSELDWKYLITELGKPPNEWSEEKIRQNISALIESENIIGGGYDRSSIMHYYFPPSWFTNRRAAKCFREKMTELSEGDKFAINKLYPKSNQERDEYLTSLKSKAQEVAHSLPKQEAQKFIDTFNGFLPKDFIQDFGKIPSIIQTSSTTEATIKINGSVCGGVIAGSIQGSTVNASGSDGC